MLMIKLESGKGSRWQKSNGKGAMDVLIEAAHSDLKNAPQKPMNDIVAANLQCVP